MSMRRRKRAPEAYSSFSVEKAKYASSLSFPSFFSYLMLSCGSIIGLVVGSERFEPFSQLCLTKASKSPSARAVPSVAFSSEPSFDGASASSAGAASVAVAVVAASKDEDEKDGISISFSSLPERRT